MKYKDVQLLSLEECIDKIKDLEFSLVKLRLAHAISPIENPMQMKKIRKDIARLKMFRACCQSVKR